MILGIDEVGRGPWAGPLVVGAVVLPEAFTLEGLTDSKKLTAKKREALDERIRQDALGWGLGWVHAKELDDIGLSKALRLATIRAVEAVSTPYHEIIIDGTINFLSATSKGQYVTTLPKADALIPAVSAASIIAKVARDTYMAEQATQYPEYGFASHVGYGTARHMQALATHGVTPEHRTSFKPIAALLHKDLPAYTKARLKTNEPTKSVGDRFEAKVAQLLTADGYTIVERNWRTRYCEIDCIATRDGVTYFTEAKFRNSDNYGGGEAALKLPKMRRAAESYVAKHSMIGEYRLMAAVFANGEVSLIEIVD